MVLSSRGIIRINIPATSDTIGCKLRYMNILSLLMDHAESNPVSIAAMNLSCLLVPAFRNRFRLTEEVGKDIGNQHVGLPFIANHLPGLLGQCLDQFSQCGFYGLYDCHKHLLLG